MLYQIYLFFIYFSLRWYGDMINRFSVLITFMHKCTCCTRYWDRPVLLQAKDVIVGSATEGELNALLRIDLVDKNKVNKFKKECQQFMLKAAIIRWNLMYSSIVRNAVMFIQVYGVRKHNHSWKSHSSTSLHDSLQKVLDTFNLWPGTCWISRSVENGCQCFNTRIWSCSISPGWVSFWHQ